MIMMKVTESVPIVLIPKTTLFYLMVVSIFDVVHQLINLCIVVSFVSSTCIIQYHNTGKVL